MPVYELADINRYLHFVLLVLLQCFLKHPGCVAVNEIRTVDFGGGGIGEKKLYKISQVNKNQTKIHRNTKLRRPQLLLRQIFLFYTPIPKFGLMLVSYLYVEIF